MAQLSQTGISLEKGLLREFDRRITKLGCQNRSEAVRDLIREVLMMETIDSTKSVVAP
jgi:CopG family transcriptional regulator, nickel-responsive regulator